MTTVIVSLTMTNDSSNQATLVPPTLLKAALEMCTEGIAIVQNNRILYANSAFARTNGFPSGLDLCGNLLKDSMQEAILQFDSGQGQFNQTPDPLLTEASSFHHSEENRQELHLICVRAIARPKRSGVPLGSREKDRIGEPWVKFAHDFNNLLTSIILYSELLISELESDSALRPHAEIIYDAGNKGAEMIKQLTIPTTQPGDQWETHAMANGGTITITTGKYAISDFVKKAS